MSQVIKKENLTISIREYPDPQDQSKMKKVWKTIGELITWDDGRQSFEMWGPTGATKGSVFSQDDNNQQGGQQGGYQQAPQGRTQQAPQTYAQPQQPPATPYGQQPAYPQK
ncbi:MAG: hypothetical protein JKY50_22540 [Oleispira sp.]|nr:hypothetical protein [Oleispira sp.]